VFEKFFEKLKMDILKCPKSISGPQNFSELFQKSVCEHYALNAKKS
jgi:hypothetical protein